MIADAPSRAPAIQNRADRLLAACEEAQCQWTNDVEYLVVGAAVVSCDGRHLGKVKEVREGYFRVDVRFAFDYWLSTHCIASMEDGRVTLMIAKAQVGEAIVDMDFPEEDEERALSLIDDLPAGGCLLPVPVLAYATER